MHLLGVLWDDSCVQVCEEVAIELRKLSLQLRRFGASAETPQLEAGATRAMAWHDDQAGALCLRQTTAVSINIMEGLYYNVKYGYAL
jgi:hypothetical protein